ncbi:MAG: type II toxin-antitoxin system HicB family antitoxin [Desulfuromonadales bacterium]|nr:type II toxin-antitoxin system HicB family antitoxin [Desulfuromonadales bacterium]
MMNKYEIIIYWSMEDQAFVAEVPELPGCLAHGPTYEEALVQIQSAMELWIETAREYNDPIPEPKGRRLAFA